MFQILNPILFLDLYKSCHNACFSEDKEKDLDNNIINKKKEYLDYETQHKKYGDLFYLKKVQKQIKFDKTIVI